ncbi:hypothetical protein L2E82_49890 [Cichorium intybus]|uniref:Uncharacterized protein n=1 Tax=Cichorium intybus TaxID=13427 RepID=A0ACB8Z1U8_CICIN|nr:hypothetical protein L2E82_49890 [Cichorium intybus]
MRNNSQADYAAFSLFLLAIGAGGVLLKGIDGLLLKRIDGIRILNISYGIFRIYEVTSTLSWFVAYYFFGNNKQVIKELTDNFIRRKTGFLARGMFRMPAGLIFARGEMGDGLRFCLILLTLLACQTLRLECGPGFRLFFATIMMTGNQLLLIWVSLLVARSDFKAAWSDWYSVLDQFP